MKELRNLHRDSPKDVSITEEFASGLSNAIIIDSVNENVLLEELRDLHRDQFDDLLITEVLIKGLLISYLKQSNSKKACALLDEFHALYKELPRDYDVAGGLVSELLIAFDHKDDPVKAGALLDVLRALHEEQPENEMVTTVLSEIEIHFLTNALKALLAKNAEILAEPKVVGPYEPESISSE